MRFSLIRKFSVLSLLVICFLAIVLAFTFSRFFSGQIMAVSAQRVADNVEILISYALRSSDFEAELAPDRYSQIQQVVTQNVLADEIKSVKIWNREGRIIYATTEELVGKKFSLSAELQQAFSGEVCAEKADFKDPDNGTEDFYKQGRELMEVYVPVKLAGSNEVQGVFEVYVEASGLYDAIFRGQRFGIFFIIVSSFVLYISLYQVVKKASDTLVRQDYAINELSGRLDDTLKHQELTHVGTIKALLTALDAKDRYTAGHSTRVTDYAMLIGKAMRLPLEKMTVLEEASLFHDIGKIGIPESILNKREILSNEEFEQIKRHSAIGANIIASISHFTEHSKIVRHHHERWDGRGYPDCLSGKDIPLESRILAVADTYDAITSDRPYRARMPRDKAISIIKEGAGSQFDPEIVEVFLKVLG